MADSEYVQLAKRWIPEPLHCATFLVELIQEFESMFTLDGGTDIKGEEWVTIETTPKYRRSLATSLSKRIRLAEKALTICNELRSEIFRLQARWQEVFINLERTIINRNVSAILGKPAIKDAEEKLAKAFILFRHVAIDLNDRIAVSDAVLAVQPSIKPKKKRKSTEGDKIRKEVLKLFGEGVRQKDIASRVHVSESRVSQILNESRPKKL